MVSFQLTGDKSWADSKKKPLIHTVRYSVQTQHIEAEINISNAQELTEETVKQKDETTCEEPTCGGHGTCVNGTCDCESGKTYYQAWVHGVSSLDLIETT